MAAGPSFLAAAIRRCRSEYRMRSTFPSFLVDRPVTTEALPPVPAIGEESSAVEADDLRTRIFRLRFPKRSATAALEKWVDEGKRVTASELRLISWDLRRAQRYKHALEISEWMIAHEEYELSDRDYATRIDLINKVFGTISAEEFFKGLPSTMKTCETYTALLHAYAGEKLLEKAESLFETVRGLGINLKTVTYNEMMTLYISVGQPDKVALIAEELKKSDVSPDLFTYNLRISACASSMNFDGAKNILDEMLCDPNCSSDWKTYTKLTDVYISVGHITNMVEAEKLTPREWITYDFLVILYAGLGNRERVNAIWKSLQTSSKNLSSRSYVCIISSYLTLGCAKEAGEILDEWKQAKGSEFDMSVCDRLYDAFLKADLVPTAEKLRHLLIQRRHESGDVLEDR